MTLSKVVPDRGQPTMKIGRETASEGIHSAHRGQLAADPA
jgi:hypothetical protein